MLEGLSDFVSRHYEKSEVLRNNLTNRFATVGISSMIWKSDKEEYTQNLWDALKSAKISDEDAASLKMIQAILSKQGELSCDLETLLVTHSPSPLLLHHGHH